MSRLSPRPDRHEQTRENGKPPHKNMVRVPGGSFQMGSDDFYPEERPVHRVAVDGFWMDEHPVTNAQFRRFVKATGYVTVAERSPDPAGYPDADPALLVPGSLVFRKTSRTRRPQRRQQLVGLRARGKLAPPRGPWQQPGRTGAPPRLARRPRGRRSLRRVGREGVADRGRVGVRRTRRARGRRPTPGATSSRPEGKTMANTWQGGSPGRT